MFFGTTPQVIAQYLHTEIARVRPPRIWVPFAGNFVVEQVAGLASKETHVHSTDVSLYSVAIGHGLAGNQMRLEPKASILEHFPHLAELATPIEKAAGVIFTAEAARNFGKDNIPYYRSLNGEARASHRTMIAKITAKLEAFRANLGPFTFHGIDACQLIPSQVKPGDMVFYDPPVLLGDYEKMFAPLEKAYDFDPVPYTQMDDEVKRGHLKALSEIADIVLYRTNNPLESVPEGYTQVFDYMYKWNARYCIYSSSDTRRWVGRFSPLREEIRPHRIIGDDHVITAESQVAIIPVPNKIGNHYRALWVHKAEMTDMGFSCLFFVDGLMIGMATIDSGLKFGTDLAQLISDPAAPSSRYRRLSKLIIMLICSEEFLNGSTTPPCGRMKASPRVFSRTNPCR